MKKKTVNELLNEWGMDEATADSIAQVLVKQAVESGKDLKSPDVIKELCAILKVQAEGHYLNDGDCKTAIEKAINEV